MRNLIRSKLVLAAILVLCATTNVVAVGLGEAAVMAVDAAIRSLTKEPEQCTATMHVGVMGVGRGAPGVVGEAHGGGPGSVAVGVQGSAGNSTASAQSGATDDDSKQKAEEALRVLNELRAELVKKSVDKPTVSSKLAELAKTYVAFRQERSSKRS